MTQVGPKVITRVLVRERGRGRVVGAGGVSSGRGEAVAGPDAGGGALSQAVWAPPEASEGEETDSPPEPPQHPDFRP